jgi:hypothetical protein
MAAAKAPRFRSPVINRQEAGDRDPACRAQSVGMPALGAEWQQHATRGECLR